MDYESGTPFVEEFHGLAVYCSDGRFAAQVDDFLRGRLKLASCDRLAVPGGPAALVAREQAVLDANGVLNELAFLVEAHQSDSVVLIAHAGCAFYSARLGLSAGDMEPAQRDDLRRARDLIAKRLPTVRVDSFFARVGDAGRVRFEPV
jgi:hypothetical protein